MSCKVQENIGKEGASFSTGGGTGMFFNLLQSITLKQASSKL